MTQLCNLYLCENLCLEKVLNCIRRNGEHAVVYGNAYSVAAVADAESAAQLHLFLKTVVRYQLLKSLNNLSASFKITLTSYTNCYLHISLRILLIIHNVNP